MYELEDPSIERRIHFGLQLMAFTRNLVKDEKAAVKIVERSFEKLYEAERKFTFVNDETVSTYLRLSAKTLADYYLKTFI